MSGINNRFDPIIRLAGAITSRLPAGIKWRMRKQINGLATSLVRNRDMTLVVKRDGLILELNPNDEVCRDIFWFAQRDTWELRFITKNLRPGSQLLDVGANLGYYSITIARALKSDCTIHAFEPYPANFDRLRFNLMANNYPCVKPHKLALGAGPSTMFMVLVPNNSGGAYVSSESKTGAEPAVEVIDLDTFAAEQELTSLQFVKVDIEGHEALFLKGAQKTLSNLLPPLMMEIHPENLKRQGTKAVELLDQLKEMGYTRFFTTDYEGVKPFGPESFDGGWLYRNVFCFGPADCWA